MTSGVVDKIYLPFPAEQLRQHLARPGALPGDQSADRQLQYYLKSARRYHDFLNSHLDRRGLTIGELREPCQIEKDERFWIAACLMRYFYAQNRQQLLADLLCGCFGDTPPVEGLTSWVACLHGDLHLYLEGSLPSPTSYKKWLAQNLEEQQIIPYVRNAACHSGKDTRRAALEGATRVDAMLLNASNGFSVLFEAKVLSDISVHVTYDARRNQLARLIDAGLEENKRLPEPLRSRRPERTLFALISPEMFRKHKSSRLYGWLLDEYRREPAALAKDLAHRGSVDWPSIAQRIGWLTWEGCANILPASCRWLAQPLDAGEC